MAFLGGDDLLALARARDVLSVALRIVCGKRVGRPSNAHILSALGLVRWARDNGWAYPSGRDAWFEHEPKSAMAVAAANAHGLAVLQELRRAGCPWDKWTCVFAAGGGQLEALKWARANGCPWDEETCSGAAGEGHLEVLKWARANGCPWDEETWEAAEDEGHADVLDWLRASGCPQPDTGGENSDW